MLLLLPASHSVYLRYYSLSWGELGLLADYRRAVILLGLGAVNFYGYNFSQKIYLAPKKDENTTCCTIRFVIIWLAPLLACFQKPDGTYDTTIFERIIRPVKKEDTTAKEIAELNKEARLGFNYKKQR